MKPKVAVHKFSSCDGCQLAFLNAGEKLIQLAQLVDIVHFAEAGYLDENAEVDIAFVEGSITTEHEEERIKRVREHSRFLITFGACATAGGIQALRNLGDGKAWLAEIYPSPEYLNSLSTSTAIADHVRVDAEIWGCPPTTHQVMGAVRSLLSGAVPQQDREKVCMECKRRNTVCVLVARGMPCMGPVTGTGCGALCPSIGRACYECFGPAENLNTAALARRFQDFGLAADEIGRRFLHINNATAEFHDEGTRWLKGDGHE